MTKHAPIQPQVVVNGVSLNATPGQRPLVIDGCSTLPALFQTRCTDAGQPHRAPGKGPWHLEGL